MAKRIAFALSSILAAAVILCHINIEGSSSSALLTAAGTIAAEEREVDNLAAFARIYGYVRFFHPSEESASVDWDKVGIVGAQTVRDAKDRDSLCTALLKIFKPIAPSIRFFKAESSAISYNPPITSEVLTFSQYLGVKLEDKNSGYRQQRVIWGKTHEESAFLFKPAISPQTDPRNRLLIKTIAPGIVLQLQWAIPVYASGPTSGTRSASFKDLQTQLDGIDPNTLAPTDWRLHVTGVITVWNIFQHFHPYLTGTGAQWEEALKPALRRAVKDRNALEYYATLSELVAKSRDGHGYIYGRPDGFGGIPIRVAIIENELVITGVADDAPFRKGDIIKSIDGIPAMDEVRKRESYIAGSPHLMQFRALNLFGEGMVGSTAHLSIVRDGAELTISYTRTVDRRGLFFNSIGEFESPPLFEVRPGIFYVNLYSIESAHLQEELPLLATARGVIFDYRYLGNAVGRESVKLHTDIIPHLIDTTIQSPPIRIPQITLPDRIGWSYRDVSWTVEPKAPRFKGKIVFINEPSVVSYGETCMSMIADYQLAKLVGAPTAGCDGSANYIPLPGGFRVMWTGTEIRKHDHSSFYTIGFVPDYPVIRTMRAVKEGRDEYLEKAIEVIQAF